MSGLLTGTLKPLTLGTKESRLAREAGAALTGFVTSDAQQLMMRVQDKATGQQIEAAIPAAALRLLANVLSEMAEGHSVTLVPLDAELSTQQAAGLLGVSRPYFIKLLEQRKMPYRKVGEQRRVRYQDLLSYMEAYKREATAGLDEMAADEMAADEMAADEMAADAQRLGL